MDFASCPAGRLRQLAVAPHGGRAKCQPAFGWPRFHHLAQGPVFFEIVRYGWVDKADRLRVEETMLAVVEVQTGCQVRVKRGDSGEIHGRLIACK